MSTDVHYQERRKAQQLPSLSSGDGEDRTPDLMNAIQGRNPENTTPAGVFQLRAARKVTR